MDHSAAVTCRYRFHRDEDDHVGMLQFYLTGEANTEERICIQGTEGRVVIEAPSHVPQSVRVEVDQGRTSSRVERLSFPLPDDSSSFPTWNYPGSVGFVYEIAAVNDALRRGLDECPQFTLDESLQNAQMLEEIRSQVLAGRD